ncbi:MAG: hypothetical protein P1V21_00190 [Rhizobiaceae bacterium]|nr:hypothetical protein [Rhizobiaceae bacterium]
MKGIAFASTAIAALVIACLALSHTQLLIAMPGTDKTGHLIGFIALTLPCALLNPRALKWLLPLAVLFGGGIEMIQPVFGRQGAWPDFYADVLGAGAGALAGLLMRRLAIRFLDSAKPR